MMKRLAHNKCAVTAISLVFALAVAAGALAQAVPSDGAPPQTRPQTNPQTSGETTPPDGVEADPEIELAPDAALSGWFNELADPDYAGWARAQSDIEREWSKSGSAAMDLLLMRGEAALDEGDLQGAIETLTALTDHAPEFAAGWTARGTAFYLAGHHGPAMVDFGRALALEPRQFAALALVGQIYAEMGNEAAAIAALNASLAINPHQEDIVDEVARLKQSQEGTAL